MLVLVFVDCQFLHKTFSVKIGFLGAHKERRDPSNTHHDEIDSIGTDSTLHRYVHFMVFFTGICERAYAYMAISFKSNISLGFRTISNSSPSVAPPHSPTKVLLQQPWIWKSWRECRREVVCELVRLALFEDIWKWNSSEAADTIWELCPTVYPVLRLLDHFFSRCTVSGS